MAGKGQPKSGGRQPGTTNKLNADIKAMILAALDKAGGAEYLYRQAAANPAAFMSLVAKVLPMQVSGEGGGPLQITITKFIDDDQADPAS